MTSPLLLEGNKGQGGSFFEGLVNPVKLPFLTSSTDIEGLFHRGRWSELKYMYISGDFVMKPHDSESHYCQMDRYVKT